MRGSISLEPSRRAHHWLRRTDFAAPFDAYREYLVSRGYTARVITDFLGSVAHFLCWLKCKRRGLADVDEAVVGRFLDRHLPVCRCAKQCVRARTPVRQGLALWLRLLRAQGWLALPPPSASAQLEAELAHFERYLIEVCGLAAGGRSTQLQHLRRFLRSCFGAGRIDFTALTPSDVRRFIERHGARWQPISLRAIGVSLRSYFRFKALSGADVAALVAAIPRVARWRLADVPQALTQQEIERLLAAFDRTRPGGRRDYAMARCLTDLGLRAREVARLQLEDVRWDEGTMRIRGKGRRVDLLPLPQKLGSALAQYLRHGRPRTPSRLLFIRLHAPLDKPVTGAVVSAVLCGAARRAGLQGRLKGARVLRHSVATHLVQRRASLKAIADLLRHRSLNTTTIYAKVDLPALARVALPWPGRQI